MSLRGPLLMLALAAATPAFAQAWANIPMPDLGVALQWPSPPSATSDAAPGEPPRTVIALDRGMSRFSLTVTDFTKGGDLGKANRAALAAARASGQVKLDVEECVSGMSGRELSLMLLDGGRSKVSVFPVARRLYVLEARLAPADVEDGSGDAARFQQSLRFSGPGLGDGPAQDAACRGRARLGSAVAP